MEIAYQQRLDHVSQTNPAQLAWVTSELPSVSLCESYAAGFMQSLNHEPNDFADWTESPKRYDDISPINHIRWAAECLEVANKNNISTSLFRQTVLKNIIQLGTGIRNEAEYRVSLENGDLQRLWDAGYTDILPKVLTLVRSTDSPLFDFVLRNAASNENDTATAFLYEVVNASNVDSTEKSADQEVFSTLTARYGLDPAEAQAIIECDNRKYDRLMNIVEDARSIAPENLTKQQVSQRQYIDLTSRRYNLYGNLHSYALRECLYGLEGVREAVRRFELPMLGEMTLDAVRRMTLLAMDDDDEIQRYRNASKERSLTLVLTAQPTIDRHLTMVDGMSRTFEGVSGYVVYHGIKKIDDPERISEKLNNDYAAVIERIVVALHGDVGRLRTHDRLEGEAIVNYSDPQNIDAYLGRLVSTMLSLDGTLVLASCSSGLADRSKFNFGRKKAIAQTASRVLRRKTIGFPASGALRLVGSDGVQFFDCANGAFRELVHVGLDGRPISKMTHLPRL